MINLIPIAMDLLPIYCVSTGTKLKEVLSFHSHVYDDCVVITHTLALAHTHTHIQTHTNSLKRLEVDLICLSFQYACLTVVTDTDTMLIPLSPVL